MSYWEQVVCARNIEEKSVNQGSLYTIITVLGSQSICCCHYSALSVALLWRVARVCGGEVNSAVLEGGTVAHLTF